jgi:hypothetical protein
LAKLIYFVSESHKIIFRARIFNLQAIALSDVHLGLDSYNLCLSTVSCLFKSIACSCGLHYTLLIGRGLRGIVRRFLISL